MSGSRQPSLPRRSGSAFAALVAFGMALAPLQAFAQATIGAPIAVEDDPDEMPRPAAVKARKEEKRGETRQDKSAPKNEEPATKEPEPESVTASSSKAKETVSATLSTIILPSDSEETIAQHWKRRIEYAAAFDGKRVEEEERELERIRKELALDNMLTVASALIREANAALKKSPQEALARCAQAARLAPDFNLAYVCVARANFAANPSDVGGTFTALNKAFSTTLKDIRARRSAVTDWLLTLLAGIALGCGVLVVLQIGRHAKLFAHDFHHLFPRGVSPWQTALVALVLMLLPLLLGMGLLGCLALAAIAVAVVIPREEAISLVVAFVLLAVCQYAAGEVLKAGAFGRTAQDVYLLERADAPSAAAVRLRARTDKGLGDYATAFALGRYYKRLGRYNEAKEAYEAARKLRETPEVLNNIGNVLFLLGDSENARQNYHEANVKNARLFAPLWNLAKIYFREGKLDQGQSMIGKARELEPDKVLGADDLHANNYLSDVALSDSELARLADSEARAVVSGNGATWPFLTGRLSLLLAVALLLGSALLIGVLQPLQRKLRPSTRCEKCGRPVCTRCDPELGQGSGLCGQCISVFVRRTGVDAPDRVRKEMEVRSYRRRHRIVVRVVGALFGGGGHVFSGRIVGGAVFVGVFSIILAQLIFWNGVLRAPVPVQLSPSPWYIGFFVATLLTLYGLSLRHLIAHEEAD